MTGWDDGAYNQLMFNTLHGRWFEGSFEMNEIGMTRLGQHFTPAIALLLPLYAIHPKTETLLVIQTFLVSLSAVLVYFLTLKLTTQRWISLVFSISFLLHPSIQAINRVSFHEVCLAPPLLLIAILLYENERRLLSLIPVILLCLIKEDMPLLVIGLGLFVVIGKRSFRWGVIYLSIGLFFFTAINFVLMPKFQEWQALYNTGHEYAYAYSNRYKDLLGGNANGTMGDLILAILMNPIRIVKIIFLREKIIFCAALLFPLGILPLLAPACLLIALPNLLTLLLSNEEWMYSFNAYYAGAFAPALYYGAGIAIYSISTRKHRVWQRHSLPQWLSPNMLAYQVLLGSTLVFTLVCWPLLKPIATLPQPSPSTEYVRDLLAAIPPNAAVGSTPRYASYLSSRREVWAFDPMTLIDPTAAVSSPKPKFKLYERSMRPALQKADWIFIDSAEPFNPEIGNKRYYEDLYAAVESGDWCLNFSDERYLIAQKAGGQKQSCRKDKERSLKIVNSLRDQQDGLNTYDFSERSLLENNSSSLKDWKQISGKFSIDNISDINDGTKSKSEISRITKMSGEHDSRLEASFPRLDAPSSNKEYTRKKEVYALSLMARSLKNPDSTITLGCSDGIDQSSEESFTLTKSYSKHEFFCSTIDSSSEKNYVYILVPKNIEFDVKSVEIAHIKS